MSCSAAFPQLLRAGGLASALWLPNAAFAEAGDSGALVLRRGTGFALGLLHSANSAYAVAAPIAEVLSQLGVSLA